MLAPYQVMSAMRIFCVQAGAQNAPSQSNLMHFPWLYREEGRHYHTLDHVADMLEGAERDFRNLDRPGLVQLAIFFHE